MKNEGFTLIELLMVSAIISLLMSVVFFNVTEAKKKGEDAHMRAESAEVAKAVYQYKEDHGGMVPGALSVTGPATLVEGSPELGGDDYVVAMQELVDGGYLSEIPYSPSGSDYSYIISDDGFEAVFAANLNYEYITSEDSNSCEWTYTEGGGGENPPQYPENFEQYVFYGCRDSDPGECSQNEQVDDTHSCIAVNTASLNQYCECGWNSVGVFSGYEGIYPLNACSSYIVHNAPFACTTYAPEQTEFLVCEHDPVYPEEQQGEPAQPSICDGSSTTDHCTCM